MSDLIDRQAAIDALTHKWNGMVTSVFDVLKELPPEQPKMGETDWIRRSETIEVLENTDWYHQNANKDMVSGANSNEHQAWYKAEDVYKALESVPSAQPEIIRCKDCKKWHTNCLPVCGKHGCDVISDYTKPDDFCSWAERRTDGSD